MATTTQIISPISSRNILGNSDLYHCRCPRHVSMLWPFHRHSKILNRHSITENSFLGTKFVFRSLPPTPRTKWMEDEEALRTSSTSCVPLTGNSFEHSSASFPSFQNEFETCLETSMHTTSMPPRNQRCDIIPFRGRHQKIERNQLGGHAKGTEKERIYSTSQAVPIPPNDNSLPASPPNERVSSSSSESSTSSSSESSTSSSREKRSRKRVKDDDGYIRRAACVCVNEEESKVVLISSKHEGGGWLVPGGGLEDGEDNVEAAKREAWEEGGITGRIDRCLGVFESDDDAKSKRKKTTVYVLKVTEEHAVFPEVNIGRVREWFSIEEAINHLSKCKPYQTAYLRAL